ncbi:unnamed protein product [Amoebophrya sp. A120]|nr:unnamed protein product [Amoebophrya sp. A120]|eukprot:GSA120T00025207001.1
MPLRSKEKNSTRAQIKLHKFFNKGHQDEKTASKIMRRIQRLKSSGYRLSMVPKIEVRMEALHERKPPIQVGEPKTNSFSPNRGAVAPFFNIATWGTQKRPNHTRDLPSSGPPSRGWRSSPDGVGRCNGARDCPSLGAFHGHIPSDAVAAVVFRACAPIPRHFGPGFAASWRQQSKRRLRLLFCLLTKRPA